MRPNTIADAITTLLLVALATTLVLPGRQTGAIVRESGNAGSKLITSAIGR